MKGISRAPYEAQVTVEMMRRGLDEKLSDAEKAKVKRVARFLSAYQCVDEIEAAREKVK